MFACKLEVDYVAGQLGLDLAQVGPPCGGARRHVDQPATRLVDGDRQAGARELAAAWISFFRLLRQRPRDDRVERLRQLGAVPTGRGGSSSRCANTTAISDRARRRVADQTLVEHARERVDVGPPVDVAPAICSGAT